MVSDFQNQRKRASDSSPCGIPLGSVHFPSQAGSMLGHSQCDPDLGTHTFSLPPSPWTRGLVNLVVRVQLMMLCIELPQESSPSIRPALHPRVRLFRLTNKPPRGSAEHQCPDSIKTPRHRWTRTENKIKQNQPRSFSLFLLGRP